MLKRSTSGRHEFIELLSMLASSINGLRKFLTPDFHPYGKRLSCNADPDRIRFQRIQGIVGFHKVIKIMG
ncbi:hypothetical protein C5167_020505 [Papaver somniferum]|uniref:Uncharacterized protein n=1 Tax=Papaver somniferum TaxID=3469 RepID=A0A4Y7IWJ1_PAPSO|nr:hypothetical protein C5167_020505 [Papaver somniferum]